MTDKPKDWLDFKAIKESADVPKVLEALGLLDGLTEKGRELVGWCPLGERKHGKKDSFAFNTEKGSFQCFACKNKGSILDLVARHEKVSLRQAAARVAEIMEDNENLQRETAIPDETEMEDTPAPTMSDTDDGSLRVTMSFQEAVLKVKSGALDPNTLQVVDMTALGELNEVFGIASSA